MVSQLRHLDSNRDLPGLVCPVALAGLKVSPQGWTGEMAENFRMLAGLGETPPTVFRLERLGQNERGVEKVRMVDLEGNDLTELCLLSGVGEAADIGGPEAAASKGNVLLCFT